MKLLFDLLPIILFFTMFKWGESHHDAALSLANQTMSGLVSGGVVTADLAPILLATALAIAVTVLQISYLLVRRKKVDSMLWLSLAIISIFGGATIYFHNETFIKWKPTVLYWCFAGSFLFSQIVLKKNLVRSMMEQQIRLPDTIWTRLSFAYFAFFSIMGCLNLYLAFNFPTATWVSYKFGSMGLIFVFVIVQSLFLAKYIEEPK